MFDLNSGAVASIIRDHNPGVSLYVRNGFNQTLGVYTFCRAKPVFTSEADARTYYVSRYPGGRIVAFTDLTTA